MMEHVLEDKRVRLIPLDLENYRELIPIASQRGLAKYSPSRIETPESLLRYVEIALQHCAEGAAIPYVVFDKQGSAYAGCTRYMNIDKVNRVLEIGSTWLGREFQGSGLNAHMKYLMVEHAFYTMNFEKVEFRIDVRNLRSRRAVEKLGARLEGVLRKNIYLPDGHKRSTCCYGLFPEDWEGSKSTGDFADMQRAGRGQGPPDRK